MKNINIILILLALTLSVSFAQEVVAESTNQENVEDYDFEDEDTLSENEAIEDDKDKVFTAFEKLFVNHTAHIYYTTAINELYQSNYKAAYENAMKAKAIYDNTDDNVSQVIALPYMPSFIRESGYTPKRIYYKMVKPKSYELKRLITKIKLISPPIASVVLKRTSTYIDVIIRNYGDLPLDDFELLLNDESIAKYEKILPNEEKAFRIESSPILYELAFKEKYGFAPNSILLSEDE